MNAEQIAVARAMHKLVNQGDPPLPGDGFLGELADWYQHDHEAIRAMSQDEFVNVVRDYLVKRELYRSFRK